MLLERGSDQEILKCCTLCPRECRVNRLAGQKGYCRTGADPVVARAALHMWEEPCISGRRGSGAVFFGGCSLGCIYCQNQEIALGDRGRCVPVSRLAEIFLELQDAGAANINLVTGEHFAPQIADALNLARRQGLTLPVIYNSGGYEKIETLRMLEGLVNVYLPDFKYSDTDLAVRLSSAPDYPETARRCIQEMVRQTGECRFDSEGYIQSGVIVRHLVLPGHIRGAKEILRYLYETYGDRIYISVMSQYTPVRFQTAFPELNRRVTAREYARVVQFALDTGITNAFIQEGDTAEESFIPAFDGTGV